MNSGSESNPATVEVPEEAKGQIQPKVAEFLGRMIVPPESWMKQGACRGLDPNLFFPIYEKDEAVPKEVCSTCPVRIECLEYSLERREDHGIWGGTTEKERRRLRRQRRRTA